MFRCFWECIQSDRLLAKWHLYTVSSVVDFYSFSLYILFLHTYIYITLNLCTRVSVISLDLHLISVDYMMPPLRGRVSSSVFLNHWHFLRNSCEQTELLPFQRPFSVLPCRASASLGDSGTKWSPAHDGDRIKKNILLPPLVFHDSCTMTIVPLDYIKASWFTIKYIHVTTNANYLRIGQSESGSDFVTISGWQVLLVQKSLFELENLMICKCGSWFSLLLWLRPWRKQIQMRLFCAESRMKTRKYSTFNFMVALKTQTVYDRYCSLVGAFKRPIKFNTAPMEWNAFRVELYWICRADITCRR